MNRRLLKIHAVLLLSVAWQSARTDDGAVSDARDAAAAFVATQAFVVGRLGRDCLELLGRHESPREFIEAWQQQNAKYYDAAIKYMDVRLRQVADNTGPSDRDGVERAYNNAVAQRGEAAVNSLFQKGAKDEVCKFELTLIDSGRMNMDAIIGSSALPVLKEVEALATWAATR